MMDMIYTVVDLDSGDRMGLDAKDIDGARRWLYWNKTAGRFQIWKGKKMLGVMYKGTFWWGYEPETGYNKEYEVIGNGAIRDPDFQG